jgi:telomere length regulation protein
MLDEEQTADPLEGYEAPSPSSSRSPSPTPSYLEEVTADPSLALDSVQKKKVSRPVYISQLIALLSERDKPDSLEMGLKWGESLIRAKRSFGGELGELRLLQRLAAYSSSFV